MVFSQSTRKKWQDTDPELRMEGIREVANDAEGAVAVLTEIISDDEDLKVRLYAIAHLGDIDLLLSLQSDESSEIQQAAANQYYRILAGSFDSSLSEQERLNVVASLDDTEALLLIAKQSSSDSAGLLALGKLDGQQCYATIVTEARTSTIRTAAAEKITDLKLIEELSNTVKHKDKHVYKLFKNKLAQVREQQVSLLATKEKARELCKNLENLVVHITNKLTQAQLQYTQQQWSEISESVDEKTTKRFRAAETRMLACISSYAANKEQQSTLEEIQNTIISAFTRVSSLFEALSTPVSTEMAESLNQQVSELSTLLANNPSALAQHERVGEVKDTVASVQRYLRAFHALNSRNEKLLDLKEAVEKGDYKDTGMIKKSSTALAKMVNLQDWPSGAPTSSSFELAENLNKQLQDLVERNGEYQKNVITDIESKLQLLDEHIENGQSRDATKLWDKIHSALNKIQDKPRDNLRKKAATIKPRLDELCDWKNFATTEKKKSLIAEIKTLSTSSIAAEERSRRIKKLHEAWKQLGHSNDNNTLWFEFKKYSDTAYEPCKEYFKEKKAKLRFNLQQRKEICSQLEQLIEDIDTSSLHISNLTRIENKATSEWKTYAPVEQSKIRSIQKRFNEVLGKIRTLRRKASHTNADAKKALIEQAIKLSENEDLRQSMDKAKDLQKQWKTIGPSNYKADQKYWNSFRNACDKIFKKRDEQAQAQRDADKHAVTEARSFLEQMENSLSVKDEDFSDVRKVFRKIQDQCAKSINSVARQEQKNLRQQLDALSKKYQIRLSSLPDRKTIQLLNSLKEKAALCEKLEEKLLSTVTSEGGFQKAEVDDELSDQWSRSEPNQDEKFSVNMHKRLSALKLVDNKTQLEKLVKENVQVARKICVEMEIQANIDSPGKDKELRMQCQLDNLKKDFGQQKSNNKSSLELIRELTMEFLCLGPLNKTDRDKYASRINAAQQKVGSF